MHARTRTWTFKRDARISLPLAEILWEKDGISYLRPEVQLGLELVHPGQPWLVELDQTLVRK